MANYTYVVDSSYQPFSLQEMLVPFNAYKEAYEKSEEAYDKLSEADDFKYLSKTLPEGSAARALYEGYANDLHTQAEDLAQNGLTMGNRKALTSLKRRYRGEIGQLTKADEALKEEKKLRQTLNAQDSSRLYAVDNLSIDDFLEGKNPNLYSISGKELYARGAQAAKAYSSRLFNTSEGPKTLGGYYIDWIQRNGISPESIAAFRENMKSIPEMYNAYKSILKETGVDKNLSGYSLERAEASVLNGMTDGFVYQETHSPQRDLGVLSEQEKEDLELKKKQVDIAQQELDLKKQIATPKQESKSKSGNTYPVIKDTQFVSGRPGSVGVKVEDESVLARGIPIKVTKKKDKNGVTYYVASIDDGSNVYDVAALDDSGVFKKLAKMKDSKGNDTAFKKITDDKTRTLSNGFDEEYDWQNIKALLQDAESREKSEGNDSFANYEYILDLDNADNSNNSGGFFRRPYDRGSGTVFNNDPDKNYLDGGNIDI